MFARRFVLVASALGMLAAFELATPSVSRADEALPNGSVGASTAVPAALMEGLGQHAARFEEMKKRGAFTFAGRMEEVDGDGHGSDAKEIVLRSTPTRTARDRITEVIRFTDNGKDKTAEAQKRATERREKRLKNPDPEKDDRGKDLRLPFLPAEQPRYVFTVAERDEAQPERVRIVFTPKTPAEDAIKGSAWVDTNARETLSMGFSFSRNPMFVDHVEVTIVFGLSTPLGRAPSKVSFDGRGGFLFIRKHYRGSATLSDPRLAF